MDISTLFAVGSGVIGAPLLGKGGLDIKAFLSLEARIKRLKTSITNNVFDDEASYDKVSVVFDMAQEQLLSPNNASNAGAGQAVDTGVFEKIFPSFAAPYIKMVVSLGLVPLAKKHPTATLMSGLFVAAAGTAAAITAQSTGFYPTEISSAGAAVGAAGAVAFAAGSNVLMSNLKIQDRALTRVLQLRRVAYYIDIQKTIEDDPPQLIIHGNSLELTEENFQLLMLAVKLQLEGTHPAAPLDFDDSAPGEDAYPPSKESDLDAIIERACNSIFEGKGGVYSLKSDKSDHGGMPFLVSREMVKLKKFKSRQAPKVSAAHVDNLTQDLDEVGHAVIAVNDRAEEAHAEIKYIKDQLNTAMGLVMGINMGMERRQRFSLDSSIASDGRRRRHSVPATLSPVNEQTGFEDLEAGRGPLNVVPDAVAISVADEAGPKKEAVISKVLTASAVVAKEDASPAVPAAPKANAAAGTGVAPARLRTLTPPTDVAQPRQKIISVGPTSSGLTQRKAGVGFFSDGAKAVKLSELAARGKTQVLSSAEVLPSFASIKGA